jgi:hypothetical protein
MSRITGVVALALALVVALAGCGGESTEGSDQPSATSSGPSEETSPSESAVSDDPQDIAADLKADIPQIGEIVMLTEDNDENDLIGRPGQYDAATFMEDRRLGCSPSNNFDGLSIDCGAKLERWPSEADAQARADDIQQKLKDFGLGAEYDYVRDRVLLRVSGTLKPSEAEAYETSYLQ